MFAITSIQLRISIYIIAIEAKAFLKLYFDFYPQVINKILEKQKGLYQICSKGLFLGRFIFSIMNFGFDNSGVFWHYIYMLQRPQTPKFCQKIAKKWDFLKNYGHNNHFLFTGMMVMGSHEAGGLLTSHDHLLPFSGMMVMGSHEARRFADFP